jgi:hypothetical protein
MVLESTYMSTTVIALLFTAALLIVFVALILLGRSEQEQVHTPISPDESLPQTDESSNEAQADPGARALRIRQAQERIASVAFDPSVERQLRSRYPQFSPAQVELVLDGLRQWFELCALVDLAPLTIPSVAVDEAWHAFICSTANYREFCTVVFGRYLDHQPPDAHASATPDPGRDARTWVAACAVEGINPVTPDRLPLIYALDTELTIPGRTSVNPATMAALAASRQASSGAARTALADGSEAHPAGTALTPTPSQPASDGRLAPADGGTGFGGGAFDWMASWLLWRSLLEPAPAATPPQEPWRHADADAARCNDISGGESGRSDRADRVRKESAPSSDSPMLADAGEASAEYGTSADDSDSDSACSGGGSNCSSGGGEA